ncbi:hypothetical protein PHMEG_0009943 [Phytophthora megakarya]|uniref:Uncharacterized protein n=1 Tax=Phytophthora megakarya TaxID=4795 RepID=A0A225WGM3_9STRA|nr:hypothetical protein PHMEG_0009943 [Phytophthora megakarya]
MAEFAIGDYVLCADVWNHRRSKLWVKWCWPAKVVDTSSNGVFNDRESPITKDLIANVTHISEGHVVEELWCAESSRR